jgi:Domain of unknown function (DUF4365)
VQAIAACAGCRWSVPTPDYGIDLTLRRVRQFGAHWRELGVPLDLQLRSTVTATFTASEVTYDLDVETYERLRRAPRESPAVLVLLVLPREPTEWLSHTEEQLELRKCAYWFSLRGLSRTRNVRSVRVRIPRRNQFSPAELERIMGAITRRETP